MGVEMGLHTFLALYVEPVPSSAQSTRLRAWCADRVCPHPEVTHQTHQNANVILV
jgi:hypothetical protein